MTIKHPENNQEQPQNKPSSKKANIAKTVAATALITIAGAVNGQNSKTIDPKYYSIDNPYMVPNLPDNTTFYLTIKTGQETIVGLNGMDAGSTIATSNPSGDNIAPINDKLKINKPGTRNRGYKENGITKTTTIIVNYQADIFDRTPGSATQNTRPDVIRVDPGQSANLSAGKYMTNYSRKNLETGASLGGDSLKIAGKGRTIAATNDGMKRTMDTIAILEKPNLDNATRTLNFPSTTTGVIYKVYKGGAGNTWVEIPSLAFTGDGNAHTVTLDAANVSNKELIKLGAQRTASTPVETNLPAIQADFTTDILEVNKGVSSFKQMGREILRDTEVPSIIYDMNGRELGTGLTNHLSIPQEISGVIVIKYTENGQIKAKKIIVK